MITRILRCDMVQIKHIINMFDMDDNATVLTKVLR